MKVPSPGNISLRSRCAHNDVVHLLRLQVVASRRPLLTVKAPPFIFQFFT